MSNPTFHPYRTVYDRTKKMHGGIEPSEFRSLINDQLIKVADSKKKAFDVVANPYLTLGWRMEWAWESSGRPYFKVWPNMESQLLNTKLNFNCDFLHSPFNVFSVLLPNRDAPFLVRITRTENHAYHSDMLLDRVVNEWPSLSQQERCGGLLVAAASLGRRKRVERESGRCIVETAFTWIDLDGEHYTAFAPLHENQTVEDALEVVSAKYRDDTWTHANPDFLLLSDEEVRNCMRVAFGVAMFAINRHKLVAPDIDQEVLLQKFPGGRSKASQKIAEEKRNREIAKCKGWKVGSEIDLPRPHVIRSGQPEERGGELTYGHIRSGHMKMQPCGPNNQDRKLIFVEPTVVRPDLPIRQMHGYRIRTKEERKARA